ncbi:MAG: ComF family protein [Paludibacteraceae bacterium]|nr:ComF family protein [Paludibacteraceae bacterium]
MLSSVLELFYPSLCILCHRGVDSYNTLCDNCLRKLPRTEHHILRDNKVEMLFTDLFNRPRKQWDKPRFVRGGAWLRYDDDVASVIHAAKFYERPELAKFLGRQAAQEWQPTGYFDDIDLLVPVPIHPRRLNERGYNQSEYICRGMSEVLGLPIDTTTLLRIRDTPKQSQLTDDKRRTNVEHAFRIPEPTRWHKRHILLVDDVITTGATIRNCIKEITPIRSCRISVFSLAVAR